MIKIIKGKEPKEWTEKRHTPGFTTYSPCSELDDALLEEQGYICAYCTCQINKSNSRVEHIIARNRKVNEDVELIKTEKAKNLELDYNNMVMCCNGKTKGEEHCDRSKKRQDISFNLFTDHFFTTLSYSSNIGTIKSSDCQYNKEINEVLNLNHKVIEREFLKE